MLKSFSPHTCAFDCEWTPCPTTARRLLGLPADVDDRAATAAVWEHYRKESDKDGQPFLKLVLSKVVSIAAVIRRQDAPTGITLTLYAHHCDEAGEAALIRNFLETVAAEQLQLWGFNSAQADVPILVQRAVALGVALPKFCARPGKPWDGLDYFDGRSSGAHMDIANILGGTGAQRPSLHELAIASGIPSKLETKGSDVANLFLDGGALGLLERPVRTRVVN